MDVVCLCPKCGSGKTGISKSSKISEDAVCLACDWRGSKRELMVAEPDATEAQINEVLGTTDMALGIAHTISKQYLLALSEDVSRNIGIAMVRAGVVGGKEDPKDLGRIIRAATLAAHRATLEEIEAIQKEKQDGE